MTKIKKTMGAILLVFLALSIIGSMSPRKTDAYVRERVYLLHSHKGTCTGVQIKAPSGRYYILTAAHCREVLEDDKAMAKSESGVDTEVSFVAEDPLADLMLLTAAGTKYLDIGTAPAIHERLHSLTHGRGMPTYRTDGEMLKVDLMVVVLYPVLTEESLKECTSKPKYVQIQGPFGIPFCAISESVYYTTVPVLPGSSGGPILNSKNELVGIVSASAGEIISGIVPIKDVNNFLKNR